jgi:uncharacterized protein YcbX
MHVKELWRFQVKSLAGEWLKEIPVGELGLQSKRFFVELRGAHQVSV